MGADTGCTFSICSKSILDNLGVKILPLKRKLVIIDASGSSLPIVGTATINLCLPQVFGTSRRKCKDLEVAVLQGWTREILLSLDFLKQINLVHSTFPRQTVSDFFNKNYDKLGLSCAKLRANLAWLGFV